MNMTEDACCEESEIWRSFRLLHCPPDLIITLVRYMYKSNRVEKVRTPIIVDPLINLSRYIDSNDDKVYRLKGIVIHHGNSPALGHYTYLNTEGPSQIIINDNILDISHDNAYASDSYILRYEEIPMCDFYPVMLHQIIVCLLSSQGLLIAIEKYLNSELLSVRKRKTIDLLKSIKFTDTCVFHSQQALTILSEGIHTLGHSTAYGTETASLLLPKVLEYILGENEIFLSNSFGISYLQSSKCSTCGKQEAQIIHTVLFEKEILSKWNAPSTQCPSCNASTYSKVTVITKLGHTIILQNSLLPDEVTTYLTNCTFYQQLKSIQVEWKACLTSDAVFMVHENVNNEKLYATVKDSGKVEVFNENNFHISFNESRQPSESCITFLDVTNLTFKENYRLHNIPDQFQKDMTQFQTYISKQDIDLLNHFDIPINIGNLQLTKDQVSKFMGTQLTDLNIDAFFSSIKSTNPNCLFVKSSWYSCNAEHKNFLTLKTKENVYEKSYIITPVNVNNSHWILVVICPSDKTMYYFDPLGKEVLKAVVDNLDEYLTFRFTAETATIMTDTWRVYDVMTTGLYPKQKDTTSCGAFICLYGKMFVEQAFFEGSIDSTTVRQLVLKEVVDEFYKQNEGKPFGIKDIIRIDDLDSIVYSICTSSVIDRHISFLKDPIAIKVKVLDGFGELYIPGEEFRLLMLHLQKRYFISKRQLTKFQNCSVFPDAEKLNLCLKINMNYTLWYIENVLTKEVLLEVLCRRLKMEKKIVNEICISTEISTYEYIKTEVNIARQARQKMQTMLSISDLE